MSAASEPIWGYSPDVPTQPGLYLVATYSPSPRPLLLHWSRDNRDWRHGVRLERVDAFYGPIDLSPLHPPASPARARDGSGSR